MIYRKIISIPRSGQHLYEVDRLETRSPLHKVVRTVPNSPRVFGRVRRFWSPLAGKVDLVMVDWDDKYYKPSLKPGDMLAFEIKSDE